MGVNKQIGAGITVWVALTWILLSFVKIDPGKLLALKIIITLLGVFIGLAIGWYKNRGEIQNSLRTASTDADAAYNDLASALDEADRKLGASKQAGGGKLSEVPVIVLTGTAGSAKTTVVLQSGLEPELLAGQVTEDGNTTSTSIANIWLSHRAALVETGAPIQGDPATWSNLAKRLQPGKFTAALTHTAGAPRAAVVCFECENFLAAGATDAAVEAAQAFRSQLLQFSASLGVNLPVYVLFTKLDRLAFFSDYIRMLDDKEARQVLGVSVPPETGATGVYGERESARLSDAFQDLAVSLSNKRTELLARESDANVVLSAYEFPREFRKLRTPLVKFLVELCRPSQLNRGPFLRGFYFCGVRPVIVEEEIAAQSSPAARARAQQASNAEATGMFSAYRVAQEPAQVVPGRRNRKRVPQWVFLPHFFTDVVLGDRSGLAVSAASSKTSFLRRLLLFSAIGLALAAGIVTLVSYLNNRALIHQVQTAAAAVSGDAASKTPSLDSLAKLDSLRQSLVQLRGYERTHAPWSYRWGLYTGSDLLPEAKRLYFDRFNVLLFSGVQGGLVSTMKSWPASPAPTADYGFSYDTLKAYLETTSNHDKATMEFLPSVLDQRWAATQTADPAREALARKQFEFYTSELIAENPYSSTTDSATVQGARHYLAQFAGVARVYQAMLTGANQANKPLIFNQRFPGSAEVVINTREVPGAFTKPGFAWMEAAIKDPGKYVNGERWVLGDQASAVSNTSALQGQIHALYYADYIAAWRDYLKKSMVTRYANLPDAAKKLTLLSSPQSPLMALFWLASQNTSVAGPAVTQAFKPLYALMPTSNVDQYIGASNTNYMTALTALQSTVDQASKLPPEQAQGAFDQVNTAANSAMLATRQTALTFGLDAEAHIEASIEKLLEQPITFLDALKPNPAAGLNGAGAGFCSTYRPLLAKFPFDPGASTKATLDDINTVFKPQQGTLWVFYQDKLSKLLVKQGSAYQAAPGQSPALTPRFVNFFNNAARFSNALYANGTSQAPKLTFALTPAFSKDVQSVTLSIDGQAETFTSGSPAKQFAWPGATPGVRMSAKSGADALYPTYDGLWGLFEFFNDADRPVPSPEWMLKSGRSDKPVVSPLTNQPIVVHFNVDMLGGPQVFQKGYFRELGCVSEVAH